MKILAALAATAVAAMVMPASAAARPRIIAPPQVSGDPTVGSTLTATGYQYSGGDASWSWWRCQTEGRGDGCSPIPGATSTTYVVRPEDVGTRLRVRLFVEDGDQSARAISAPSDVVTQPPPPPPPVPTPTPPEPGPPPPATTAPAPPTANPLAPTVPAGAVIGQEVARTLRMMRPAPVVRIRGYLTARGARVTLLTVSAPRGAAIAVSCRGRSCPLKKWAKATKVTRLLRFQRVLAAGTRLTIRVTKPGRIGKYTEIVIRSGKAPWRRDRCLKPGSSRPLRCPSA